VTFYIISFTEWGTSVSAGLTFTAVQPETSLCSRRNHTLQKWVW